MSKLIPAVFLFVVLATPSLFGQNAPRGNHQANIAAMVQRQVNRLTTLLDLTPGQQSSLTELFTKKATANQPLMSNMRSAEQSLHTAEKNNDPAGIQSASTQIGNITAQLTANRSMFNAGIAQILTPEQMAKYKALGAGAGGFRGRRFGPAAGGPAGAF